MGYQKDTLKGISWMGALRGVTRSLALVKTIILARLLSPAEFGVFGIATLILAFLEILTETGVNIFLIQEGDKIDDYIDTAWIVSIIRGALIAILLIITAPFIATFFHTGDSKGIIMLLAIVPFLRGFINPSIVKFQKNLQFKQEFLRHSSIFALDTLFAITVSLITKSVISLIIGMVAGVILEIILSYKLVRPWPKFKFDKEKSLQIMHNGKWVTGAGIFQFFFQNLDNIVVGRMLGTYSLGLYDMAYTFSSIPITEIADTVSKVTFPVYTKFSDDKARLRRAFIKTILGTMLITIPIGLALFIFSEPILTLLGPKWLPAVPALRVLTVFGVVRAISGSSSALFLGIKKQNYVTALTLFSILGLALPIVPLVAKFGILGAAFSVVCGTFVAVPTILFFLWKVFKSEK